MPEITFRVARHVARAVDVVEVWYGDRFIATVVPAPPGYPGAAVTVVSKYTSTDEVVIATDYPPVVLIPFKVEDA